MNPPEVVRTWNFQELRNRHFLKLNWLSVLVWPFVGAVLATVLWGFALSKFDAEKVGARSRIAQEAATLSRAYAKQMARSIEKMDELTLYVKYDWEASRGKLKFDNFNARGLFKSADFISFLVVGPDGKPVTSTLPFQKDVSFLDRAYFNYHARFTDPSLRISTPTMGKISGKRVIHLTRRLEKPDGSFAGVLVVGIALDFFSPFSDDTDFGQGDLLAVIGEDGVVKVSGVGGVMGTAGQFTLQKVPKFEEKEWTRPLLGKEWFTDGKPRMASSTALPNYPYRTLVALSEEDMMLPFEEKKAEYYRACTLASVILLFFVLVAMYLSIRLAIRKGEEDELRRSYRVATERGQEGFFSWRCVRERNGFIQDFKIADCNERGAEMYGMTKGQLIGARVSQLHPGAFGDNMVGVLRSAYQAGFYKDDIELPPESRIQAKWIHRKMVRTREGVAVTLRDISDLRERELEMARLATEDALTGLFNRHWLTMNLPGMLAKARANQTKLALLFIDLDDFKKINDSLGHSVGDELLKAAAARLRLLVRPGDSVARLGGDEFTIILDPVAGEEHVGHVATRIVDAFKEPFELSKSRNCVSTSIGIGIYPQDAQDFETLLKCADLAMYSAKDTKGQFCFYESRLYERFRIRMDIEQELQRALDEDQFVVHYQPRAETQTGELVGFEALVRWQHPTKGLVAPSEFIPIAEASDLILKLGAAVMHKVADQVALWKNQGLPVVPVSVNVSARQFNKSDVKGLIANCLQKHNLDPGLLEVELTESTMMGQGEDIRVELDEIGAMGIKVHVDDFGTGYSSLALLQQLHLDVLKVDRAFTSKLGTSSESEIFFRAIVSMAHALGMSVVAEGVENEEQLRVLQGLDCDEIQGFYVSKPLPAEDIPALMAKRFLFPASLGTGRIAAERPALPAPEISEVG